jgi:hypothetical protein
MSEKHKKVRKLTNSDLLRFRILTTLPEIPEFKKLKHEVKDIIIGYIVEEIDSCSE